MVRIIERWLGLVPSTSNRYSARSLDRTLIPGLHRASAAFDFRVVDLDFQSIYFDWLGVGSSLDQATH